MGSYGIIARVIMVIFGVIWCKEIFGRLRSDIRDLKETDDRGHKGVIIFFWVLTLGILMLMAGTVWSALRAIFPALR